MLNFVECSEPIATLCHPRTFVLVPRSRQVAINDVSFVAEHSQYSSIVMFFENYSKLRLILCHAFKMPSKASQLPLVRRDRSAHAHAPPRGCATHRSIC